MTITQLRYIIAVDTHRHFATAAEKCFVTQPTLSMQIRKLEDELGLLVFDRSRQPVEPTPMGRQILEQARVAVQEADRVLTLVEEGRGDVAGEFRLGIIPTVAPTLLPRFLGAFTTTYPKVSLSVEELPTARIVEKLKNDQLDAAILATPLTERGIEEEVLYYEPFMAFIPSGHRLADDEFVLHGDLDVNDVLLLHEGHCFRNSVINICQTAFDQTSTRSLRLESGSFDTLIKLSRQGFGMTLIPYLKAIEMTSPKDRANIKPFAAPKPAREISLIFGRGQFKTHILRALADCIKESVPEKLLEAEQDSFVSPIT